MTIRIEQYYRDFLQKARVADVEAMIQFTEHELTDFLRQYVQADFTSVYECTDRGFFDRVRSSIPVNAPMRQANQQSGERMARALKFYSEFLQSKFFPRQERREATSPGVATATKDATLSDIATTGSEKNPHEERQETEGEREHVAFERAHRNPALRQRCLERWGYQCQCCGLEMAKAYGDELGGGFIEVHHLKPIATYDERRPDDYVANLVPLCPNCHAMIHRGPDGPLSLGRLREAYVGPKYDAARWKED